MRMFPSIINCCTIDWYNEWPTEALLSVAKSFMSKIELGKEVTPDAMADISVLVHEVRAFVVQVLETILTRIILHLLSRLIASLCRV